MKSVAFYAVFLLAGIINLLTIVAQQFPKYTKSLDDGTGTMHGRGRHHGNRHDGFPGYLQACPGRVR